MNFYTESKGHPWHTQACPHRTAVEAISDARRVSLDCIEVHVWDCTAGPVGFLVGVASRGEWHPR